MKPFELKTKKRKNMEKDNFGKIFAGIMVVALMVILVASGAFGHLYDWASGLRLNKQELLFLAVVVSASGWLFSWLFKWFCVLWYNYSRDSSNVTAIGLGLSYLLSRGVMYLGFGTFVAYLSWILFGVIGRL